MTNNLTKRSGKVLKRVAGWGQAVLVRRRREVVTTASQDLEIEERAEKYYFEQMLESEGNLRRKNGLGFYENLDDLLELSRPY